MLPTTVERVPSHTAHDVNVKISRQTADNVAHYGSQGDEVIEQRLRQLDQEWNIERTLEANAATVALAGLGLGAFVDRRFFALPAVVGCFLLQHALQGWCPPLAVFRRMGIRTQAEIDEERYALKAVRGDFEQVASAPSLSLQAARR
jgi:hypothetical protein